ncbi:Spermidine synthase [Chitinispirillum alkaliphilum]|nr:Spermidine synthase [Chitinispirillum alkaliphilum]
MQVYLYFILFFIAGISGLIYESIWSQYIKHILGHAAYSQTLVLVVYMGGMALGAWIVSSKTSKLKNLLSSYALVQVLLGTAALLFHGVFIKYLDFSYETVFPFLNSPFLISVYKWVTASFIILPQSILLGATFPLMAGGVIRRFPGLSGYKISVLYFVNALGASLGVIWSGFFLVERFGLRGAVVTGGILDIVVGMLVFYLFMRDRKIQSSLLPIEIDTPDEEIRFEIPSFEQRQKYYYPLLAVACLTSVASFIYEIGWIRMLSLVLGSSTHSFELMLSAFILGLALGSFFIRNRVDRIKNIPRFLGVVQVIMGITALMTLFTYGNMFNFMQFTMNALERNEQGYLFFNIISHVICLIVMLPSTICAGMVIPLVTHLLYKKGFGEQTIGKVYAVNTFGGIVGVIMAIWILMPLFGLRLLISLGGTLDIMIGMYVLYTFTETRDGFLKTALSPVCVVIVFSTLAFGKIDPILMASGVFRYGNISRDKSIISHRDGRAASVSLFSTSNNLVLSTNGKPDASVGKNDRFSSDEYTMAMLGVIPMAVKDSASSAAVIGMGAGMTSHFLLYDEQFENVDVIEIEPEMSRAAKRMGERVENTFIDPRSRIYFEDAKTFFSSRNETYDIIISEPSNPWVSGVSGLFSREFFHRIGNYISKDGILVQWFHKYECDISIVVSILKALRESFPVYELYAVGSDYIIVASQNPQADISIKRDVFEIQPLGNSLSRMGFLSIDDIKLIRFANNTILDPLIDAYDYPANSDYHPFVDLHAVKHRFMGSYVEEFDIIRRSVVPVRKIAEWDTSYIHFDLDRFFPDIFNMEEIYDAKELYRMLVESIGMTGESHPLGSSVMVLEHLNVNPDRVSFYQLQTEISKILESTMPFLSAKEMRGIWGYIKEKTSALQFTASEEIWMKFLEALCSYDMYNVNDFSRLLIPDGNIADNHINRVLLTSLFASSAHIGDFYELDEIWERYSSRNYPHLIVRLARDIALSRREEQS